MKSKRNIAHSGAVDDCPLSDSFLEDFLNPFLAEAKSERTRYEYGRRIRAICSYFYHMRGEYYEFHRLDFGDAKHYFLEYLPSLCEKGSLSYETYCSELSCARIFGAFIEKRMEVLQDMPDCPYAPYENPFYKIQRPALNVAIKTDALIEDSLIDEAIYYSKEYDSRLFIIYLLSLRMVMTDKTIFSLKRSMISFIEDGNRLVGVIAFAKGNEQQFKRIPSDIVQYFKDYLDTHTTDYIIVNKRGNQMNRQNLTDLLNGFEQKYGFRVLPRQMRSKGLLDLVKQNPDSVNEVMDFAGLSEQSIRGYGMALDNLSKASMIAESSTYKILAKI